MIRIDNYTIKEFEEQIEKKKIICFCAGQKFLELCDRYPLGQNLLYVVDNYARERSVRVGDRDIPIVRMAEMGEEIKKCLLLLTSMRYADEIISRLDRVALCDGLTFYVPDLFGMEADSTELPQKGSIKIPKRIHYCWFGKGKMPEQYCKNLETWKKYCHGYEIIRWDENNYDVLKNTYMKQAYEAKMWGFVSDYARIDIVNRYGGIYLDTDVEILRPLDSLLQYELFCGFESYRYVAFGLGFGATKNNCILGDILEEYERTEFYQKDGKQNLITCPVYQTRVLERYGLVRNGKTQIREHFTALSPEYLCPLNQYGAGRISPRSFSIHQYAATWLDSKKKAEMDKTKENYQFVISRMGQGC